MWSFGSSKPALSRDRAMASYPVRLPDNGREERDGKLYVTIEFKRPGWQRMLGAEEVCERTFGLDPYGREVYEACDGQTKVDKIVKRFAKNHKITIAEAEVSVTTFLQTMMQKGMVGMAVEKS